MKADLLIQLRDFCKKNSIFFIPGPEDYENAVADYHIYDDYELILTADLSFSPDFDNDTITYTGTIGLGRKRECETESSLNETFEQKFDNRLLELSDKLIVLLQELTCQGYATVTSCDASYTLNRFDLNADFVIANITMVVE